MDELLSLLRIGDNPYEDDDDEDDRSAANWLVILVRVPFAVARTTPFRIIIIIII